MKAKILLKIQLALLIVFPVICNAQQANYIFTSAPSPNNSPYVARDFIKLLPGFTYSGANGTFHAKIDENLIPLANTNPSFPLTENSPELDIDANLPVAAINGTAGVSQSGGATYQIPIGMPPGTKGIVPNLSVAYNSQSGNGLLGLGWNLTGLSSVNRISKTFYKNGDLSGVNLNSNDRFALDGNRLVLTSNNNYGDNNAEYHTENETFSKITSYGVSGTGPSYFTVITTEGTIIEYGNTSDSRFIPSGTNTVYSWYINKITDRFGNYMVFKYRVVDDMEILIDEVNYTGNNTANLLPYNKVKFYYEKRTDPSFVYVGGVQIKQTVILSKIKVLAEEQIRDEYTFDYFFDNILNATKLKKINQKVKGQTDINATKVLWYDNTEETSFSYNPFGSGETGTGFPINYTVGDFNGDGKSDIIALVGNSDNGVFYGTNIKLYYSKGIDNGIQFYSQPDFTGSFGSTHDVKEIFGNDIDNDGIDEIIIKYKGVNSGGPYEKYYYYELINNALVEMQGIFAPYTFLQQTNATFSNPSASLTMDFNGDGRRDMLFIQTNYQGFNYISKSVISTNNGYVETGYGSVVGSNSRIYFLDFNGNGKTDIMCVGENSTTIYEAQDVYNLTVLYSSGFPLYSPTCQACSHKFHLGDFNGDRKTDILFLDNNVQKWKIAYSIGNGFTPSITINELPYRAISQFYIKDVNNDGKDDIVEEWGMYMEDLTIKNDYINIYFSNTNSFRAITIDNTKNKKNGSLLFGDFNGDGYSDILGMSFYNVPCRPYILYTHLQYKTHLIKFVIDGFKTPHEFTYKTLSCGDNNFYTKGNDNIVLPFLKLQPSIYCVNSLKTIESNTTNSITNYYSYEKLLAFIEDYKNLGFSKITKQTFINTTEIGKSISFYDFTSFLHNPILLKTENWIKNNSTYIKTDEAVNEYFTETIFGSTNNITKYDKAYFLSAIRSTTTNDLINDTKKVSGFLSITNDAYWTASISLGKPSVSDKTIQRTYNSVASATPTDEVIKEISYKTPLTYSTWYASLVTEEKTTQTLSGASSYIRTKSNAYDSYDRLESVTVDKNNLDFDVKTEYKLYNTFGLPTKIVTNPPTNNTTYNLSIITETNTYDDKCRFVITKKNALDYMVISEYEPFYGNIVKSTDANGLITKFEYDNLGRKKKTIFPDNTTETATYNWVFGSPYPSNSLYKVVSSSSGNPDVVTLYDQQGRNIRTESTNFNGEIIWTSTIYNEKGQVYKTSLPYLANTTNIKYIMYEYDYLGRKTKETKPDNSFASINYSITTPRLITTQTGGAGISPQSKETKLNCLGNPEYVKDDNGKKVNYIYNSAGQPVETWVDGMSAHVLTTYNFHGKRTSINDPDAGLITTVYDAYDQIRVEKNGNQNVAGNSFSGTSKTYTYDILGRIVAETQPEFTTTYSYNNTTPKLGTLQSVSSSNGTSNTYDYDAFGREILSTEEITENGNVKSFNLSKSYDANGRVNTITYPNGVTIKYYYQNGELSDVKKINADLTEMPIWHANSQDILGNYNSYVNGGLTTLKNYDENTGQLLRIQTGSSSNRIQDFQYEYDALGNLKSRTEYFPLVNLITFQKEEFKYDNLNRLYEITYSDNTNAYLPKTIEYDPAGFGNIIQMPYVGTFTYGENAGMHALTSITPQSSSLSPILSNTPQNITYTSFNKVLQINENNGLHRLEFTYGSDYSRRKTTYYYNNSTTASTLRYYALGCYEEEVNVNTNTTTKDLYISGGDGLAAIFRITTSNPTGTWYFIHKDHLGSFDKITDINGDVVDSYSFDAWGNRVGNLWNSPDQSVHLFARGFTGHEHLDIFGIINMNGRLYDPKLGRFLSPDPYLQEPDNSQSFNRYSYCFNNPLAYVDPDGEIAWFVPIIMGAAINTCFYAATVAASPGGFNNWDWGSFGAAFFSGVINGAISAFNPLSFNFGPLKMGVDLCVSFGSTGFAFGADLGCKYMPFHNKWMGVGLGVGYQYSSNSYGMNSESSIFTAKASAFLDLGKGWELGYYQKMYAANDITSQRNGGVYFSKDWDYQKSNNEVKHTFWGRKEFKFTLENDLLGDGDDKYRTHAMQIDFGYLSVRAQLFTGDKNTRDGVIDKGSNVYPYGYYVGGNVDSYRLGALTFGYKNFRVGVNSENVRHVIQNGFHNLIENPAFKKLNNDWSLYYYTGSQNNLW